MCRRRSSISTARAARHLISLPVVTALGLTAAKATDLTNSVFTSIPQGKEFFPEGAFLRNVDTKQIVQYSGGEGHWVSFPVGTKLGLGAGQVINIGERSTTQSRWGTTISPKGCSFRMPKRTRSTSIAPASDTRSQFRSGTR